MINNLKDSRINSENSCVSEELMQDYLADKLSNEDRHKLERHMLDCELCADVLEGLTLVKNPTIIPELEKQVNVRFGGDSRGKIIALKYKWWFAAAATLLLFIGMWQWKAKMEQPQVSSTDLKDVKENVIPVTPKPTSPLISNESTLIAENAEKGKLQNKQKPSGAVDKQFPMIFKSTEKEDLDVAAPEANYKPVVSDPSNDGIQTEEKPLVAYDLVKAERKDSLLAIKSTDSIEPFADKRVKGKLELNEVASGKISGQSDTIVAFGASSYKWNNSDDREQEDKDSEKKQIVSARKSKGYDTKPLKTLGDCGSVASEPDVMPTYSGGQLAVEKYVKEHLVCDSENWKGKQVLMEVIVNTKGKLIFVQHISPESGENSCDLNIKAILEKMPAWVPGVIDGKKVCVRMQLLLNF